MKKKVLLVLPRQIHPVIGGYANKNHRLIDILHRNFDLTVVVVSSQKITDEERSFFETHTQHYRYLTIPKWRFLVNAFFTLFTNQPIQVGYFYFGRVQRAIDKLLPQQDVVIGALVRTMKYLERVPQTCTVVFDMVDSIGLNYQRSQENVRSAFWRAIYRVETNRLLRYEKYWVERAGITYLFNEKETAYWSQYGYVCLLPHGVNDRLFDYQVSDHLYQGKAAFIGKMDYQPNVDAVKWYVENVHTKIGDRVPFVVVGAYPTAEILALAEKYPNVEVTGFVDDPFAILCSASVVVAPMQTGGGIQNKVLEAMALGTVNVLSSLAAMPIVGAKDGQDFVIADTPEDFARTVVDVVDSSDRYVAIKTAAREFIKSHYTWKAYERDYVQGIEKILNR